MTLSTTEITNTVTVTENPDSITIVADNFTQNVGGGGGTVTSVSVTSANGVSGTVANATSTPAITISLGAITPTTVNGLTLTTSTGTVTITNLKTFAVTNTLTLSGTDGSTLNIGAGGTLGSAAFTASSAYLAVSNNLSDLASASTARTNLGLGTLATQSGTFSGTSSGTNTGDQTSIVGITGTFAEFNTAVTDADLARTSGTNTFTGTQTFSSVVSSGVSALFLDTGDDGNSGLFSVYSGIGVGTANLITSVATTTRNNELPDLDGTFLLTTGAQSIQDKTISGIDNTISNIALSSLAQSSATTGQVPTWNGSAWAAATPSGGGTKTIAFFSPLDNQPPTSAFATLDIRNSIVVLDFDDTTEESATFVGIIPEGATLTSGIKVRIFWAATSATSGACRWGAKWEKNGTDIDSDSYDTATEATTTTSGTSGIESITEITCTAIDSLAAGDRYRICIYRDTSDAGDTMTGDAEITAIELRTAN